MTAHAQDQPATTEAGAPPLPVTLRAIAAWLESHPEFVCHQVNTIMGPVKVQNFGAPSLQAADDLADRVGGLWATEAVGDLIVLSSPILPGVTAEITTQRRHDSDR